MRQRGLGGFHASCYPAGSRAERVYKSAKPPNALAPYERLR
ncbi:hypothetical protein [Dendronalium sp. ChiSLP03b]|nr:hypothetical protein [Dendronalium sp. ChiSLP03b]